MTTESGVRQGSTTAGQPQETGQVGRSTRPGQPGQPARSGQPGTQHGVQQSETPERTDIGAYTIGQKVALGGSGLAVVGAFLPWLTVEIFDISKTGIDGDGVFTLIFGLVVLGLVLYRGPGRWGRKSMIGVVLLGVLTALVGIAYINDPLLGVENAPDGGSELVSLGIGLYVTAAAGVVMAIGPILDRS